MSRRHCDLPEEILNDILIRLPVKSVGRSRCVSKHWNSLLTSPRFITTHNARSSHSQQDKLLILRDFNSLFSLTLRPDGVAEGTLENPNSIPTLDHFILVGNCNGLVLIGTQDSGQLSRDPVFLLMNPTTLEHCRLPPPPMFDCGPYEICMRDGYEYGFGFDSSSHDYKVVNFFVVVNMADSSNPASYRRFADIYSVMNKCWRRVNFDHWLFYSEGAGVFVNGALHWYCVHPEDTIVAVDLATEKCFEIPCFGCNKVDRLVATKGGSSLGLVCWDKDEARIDIWTMNEYGRADSWTKNVYVDVGFSDMVGERPWFWRNALVIKHPDKLTFYSFSDEKSFTMTLDTRNTYSYLCEAEDGHVVDGLMFSESFVSPLSL